MSDHTLGQFVVSVRPEWTLAGHLTAANFLTVFDLATDAFREHLGLGRNYADANARSIVVVEAHLTYSRETRAGDPLRIRTRLLGVAPKRMHVFHTMHRDGDDDGLATAEMMLVHIDRTIDRSVAFAAEALARMCALVQRHTVVPLPAQAGRSIRFAPEAAGAASPTG